MLEAEVALLRAHWLHSRRLNIGFAHQNVVDFDPSERSNTRLSPLHSILVSSLHISGPHLQPARGIRGVDDAVIVIGRLSGANARSCRL